MHLENKKVGDTVYMECFTSIGQSSTGNIKITSIITKYDKNTGDPFNVLITDEVEARWDSRTGFDYDNDKSMYYVE